MHFDLVDSVVEQSDDHIVTIKCVTLGEEYLQDHFATWPVLPGVMMLEAMVQAGRRLLQGDGPPLVLGEVRGVRYGQFVHPGSTLRIDARVRTRRGDGSFELDAKATVLDATAPEKPGPAVASGRLVLRPARPA